MNTKKEILKEVIKQAKIKESEVLEAHNGALIWVCKIKIPLEIIKGASNLGIANTFFQQGKFFIAEDKIGLRICRFSADEVQSIDEGQSRVIVKLYK